MDYFQKVSKVYNEKLLITVIQNIGKAYYINKLDNNSSFDRDAEQLFATS